MNKTTTAASTSAAHVAAGRSLGDKPLHASESVPAISASHSSDSSMQQNKTVIIEQPRRKKVSPMKDTLAGGFGGVCVVLAGHPFDTIKVRLQTMPSAAAAAPGTAAAAAAAAAAPRYTGMLDVAAKTIKHEGVSGLYKGMSAPLAGIAPIFALSFFGYSVGKRLQQNKPDDELNPAQLFAAGAFSGVLTTAIMSPGERIKCLLQVQQGSATQTKQKYAGPVDVIKQLYREGGVRSIYRGTVATLLRDVPASGMYFMTYDWLKQIMSGGNTSDLTISYTILAGGLAGVANWIVALPPDAIKSRLQSAPEGTYPGGVRQVAREIIARDGIMSFYRGFTPVFIRAFVANAACFLGYEVALWAFNYRENNNNKNAADDRKK